MASLTEYLCEIEGSESDLTTIADLIYKHATPVRGKFVDLICEDVLDGVEDFGIDVVTDPKKRGLYDFLEKTEKGFFFRGASCDDAIAHFCEVIGLIFDVVIRLDRRHGDSESCETREFQNGGWRVLDFYRENLQNDEIRWMVRDGEMVDESGRGIL